MALRGGARVDGLRDLVRDMESVGVDVADLKTAFAAIAAKGATLAASLAPRRSGALAASIKGNRAKNYAAVSAGSARVPYAGPINYGWPRRHIPAAEFMQRADIALRAVAVSDLDTAVAHLLAGRGLT